MIRLIAIAIVLALSVPLAVTTFQKIADTSTAVPDGTGTFDSFPNFEGPAIDSGKVVFLGYENEPNIAGIYPSVA